MKSFRDWKVAAKLTFGFGQLKAGCRLADAAGGLDANPFVHVIAERGRTNTAKITACASTEERSRSQKNCGSDGSIWLSHAAGHANQPVIRRVRTVRGACDGGPTAHPLPCRHHC